MLQFLTLAPLLLAGLADPNSWSAESPNGEYVLVMIAASQTPEYDATSPRGVVDQKILQLRAKYTQSGLYRNDGSSVPLWTLPYRGCDHPLVLNDGQHVILANEHWRQSYNHVATFYAGGNKLASHQLENLASHYQFTVRWIYWPECESFQLDEDRLELTLKTNQGETYVFDVTTGQVIYRSSRYPRLLGMACVVVFGLTALSTVFYFLYRKGAKPG